MNSNIHDNITADEAIRTLTEALCDICMSDKVMCPVDRDVDLCPCDVVEKAQYEYFNGCD